MSTRSPFFGSAGAPPSGSRRLRRYRPVAVTGAVLPLVLAALALAGLVSWAPALAAEPPAAVPGLLSFDEAVRISLRQSPYLTKSSMEIDLRRLDESDSRFGMIPSLSFHTFYYVNHPHLLELNPKPYSLNFTTEAYNPIGSYFTLQVSKLATQVAILGHLEAISDGLMRLGRMFLEMDTLKKTAAQQADLINIAREKLTYYENRLSLGTATSLEVKVASQELQLALNEKDQIALSQKRVLANMRSFMGFKPEQEVQLDLRDVRQQVLGSFTPEAASVEQAKARSYELKALALKREIQSYNISLAKTRMLPTFMLNVQNPDPLSLTTATGLYAGIGLQVPVWDGFKRLRNVSRQKTVLRQMSNDKEQKEADFEDKWLSALQEGQNTAAALKVAQSQEELAQMKERQAEIRYHSGGEPLPVFLDGRLETIRARKNTMLKLLDNLRAVLAVRQLSGDLSHTYVDASSYQK